MDGCTLDLLNGFTRETQNGGGDFVPPAHRMQLND